MSNGDFRWRKSSFSSGDGQCVEVAPARHGFAVRDSKNAEGGRLVVGSAAWRGLVTLVLEPEG